MENTTKKATLLLADGTVFYGSATGLNGTTYGEICFNTGMTGYQEIFTDPSYFGQLMVMATSHIGNYGVHAEEVESSNIQVAGLITKNFSEVASRSGKMDSLYGYFEKEQKVAIKDIDTRALVRHIRDAVAASRARLPRRRAASARGARRAADAAKNSAADGDVELVGG